MSKELMERQRVGKVPGEIPIQSTESLITAEFCKLMVKAARVYRKEDLDREFRGNSDFNAKGEPATIFFSIVEENIAIIWRRKTYLLSDGKIDPNNPNAKKSLIYKTEMKMKAFQHLLQARASRGLSATK